MKMKQQRWNTEYKGLAHTHLYDSDHRFRGRVLLSLLLKAEMYVKVRFSVFFFFFHRVPTRIKVDVMTYPSMVTEDGVCLSWHHRPKKGKSVTGQKENTHTQLFYLR